MKKGRVMLKILRRLVCLTQNSQNSRYTTVITNGSIKQLITIDFDKTKLYFIGIEQTEM